MVISMCVVWRTGETLVQGNVASGADATVVSSQYSVLPPLPGS